MPVSVAASLSPLGRLRRLWRTIRHLRPIQFYGRAWFLLKSRAVPRRAAPALRTGSGGFLDRRWRRSAIMTPGRARFIGQVGSFGGARGWDDPATDKLWRYNLHYHDDLVAVDAELHADRLQAHVSQWIAENPIGRGSGWEPYPLSLRIVNWVKWDLRSRALRRDPACLESLAAQVRALARRIEWHLLGNHLWTNAKALIFAGSYFSGPEADRWRRLGLRVLGGQLDEQILRDGGQFERSPMYQAIMLEDLLDLINLARWDPSLFPAGWRDRIADAERRMRRWLRIMTHPDGGVAFFNDATLGVAAECAHLDAYAVALGLEADTTPLRALEVLPDSGYARLQSGRAVVICDVAPVGPDYQPGHAHADTLSFECSIDGVRCIVNGGTSTYAPGPRRDRERGTASHSTVLVDAHDSSEVWGGFRVGHRARATLDMATDDAGRVRVEGHHDGYRRLPGRVVHRRRWELDRDGLVVRDILEGRPTSVRAIWLLSDAIAVSVPQVGTSSVELALPSGTRLTWQTSAGRTDVVTTDWAPGFADVRQTRCIVTHDPGTTWTTSLRW